MEKQTNEKNYYLIVCVVLSAVVTACAIGWLVTAWQLDAVRGQYNGITESAAKYAEYNQQLEQELVRVRNSLDDSAGAVQAARDSASKLAGLVAEAVSNSRSTIDIIEEARSIAFDMGLGGDQYSSIDDWWLNTSGIALGGES